VADLLLWTIPGSVLLMVAVGFLELWRHRRGSGRASAPLTATYINEFTAMFYGTKRTELDHRDSMSLMREEDASGAPPPLDLDSGVVRLSAPAAEPGECVAEPRPAVRRERGSSRPASRRPPRD
jgi:hypothetical protein